MEEKDDYPTTQYTPLTRRKRIANTKLGGFYQRHKIIAIAAIMLLLLLPLLGLLALRDRHSARADWVSPVNYPSRESIEESAMKVNETNITQLLATGQATGLMLTTRPTTWWPT